jgi:hypothetical protein
MKTAAYILLFVLLSAQTPFGQVFKLPLLVEHFLKHQEQSGISLFSFVVDHYSHEHQDADRSEDGQLPFKTGLLLNIGSAIVPQLVKADFSVELNFTQKVAIDDSQVPQKHSNRIFHPPCTSEHATRG